jgi:hypothetical protein
MRISLVAVAVAGCGGGGGGSSKPLDCAYLASANCWKTTVDQAATCLPPAAATGVLAADNSSCTYASGTTIAFTPALPLPLPQPYKAWNFTITTGGTQCLHYEETSSGFDLVVGTDMVSEAVSGAAALSLTCPDGSTYSNANALDLLNCNGQFGGGLPGNATSDTSTSVTFSFIGTSSGTAVELFNCSR